MSVQGFGKIRIENLFDGIETDFDIIIKSQGSDKCLEGVKVKKEDLYYSKAILLLNVNWWSLKMKKGLSINKIAILEIWIDEKDFYFMMEELVRIEERKDRCRA